MHDLIIIGGGPAGLSGAVNGAAEGLSVALLEGGDLLGGQAGTSSCIENYVGFGRGVSGAELTEQTMQQAERLGAELKVNSPVVKLSHSEATGFWVTECKGGEQYVSPSVLLAVGVDYRKLSVPGSEGDRVLYGAPASSHVECQDEDVLVIGGGNSAGQAALNLANHGARVTLLVRRSLAGTMSQYLIQRIATHPLIDTRLGDVRALDPDSNEVTFLDGKGVERAINAKCVFAYIGSEPRTDFLDGSCKTDDHGFVTGDADFMAHHEGLFVAGDVRSGSRKRVAVAAGEGAISAAGVWRFLYDK